MAGLAALIPPILTAILVIYVANGASSARLVLLCVVGVSVCVLLLAQTYRWTLGLPDAQTTTPITIGAAMSYISFSPRIVIGSIVAFIADMVVITIVYQGLRNAVPKLSEWWVVGIALLAAFWTDLLVFSAIVDWGSPSFVEELPAGLLSKSVAALILWLPVSYYLTQVAPRSSFFVGGENRPLFDIFLNRPDALRMALDAAEAERLETLSEKKRESVYNEQIVNNIKDALWLADLSQKTVYFVNPAYERLWGRPAADFINDVGMFEASLHPEDRERVVRGYADHSKGDYSIEYRIIRPNGEVRWVHDRVVPIRDEAGVIYRYAGLTTDITELREAEIHRLQLVVEREKVQMLREFVAEVTHDLKTPLSSIHLKLYQASKLEDPVKRAHVLDEVRDQAERMGSMINDLLTLSRLESMSDPSLHRTSLNEIVVNVTQTRVGLASKKDIALTETLVQDVPLILADEDDLGRAIGNLVDNAIHYTPRGGRVELETAKEGRFAVITVRDTGIGIAESDLPNIFKRFFRAENGRAADPGGTGLGLAIVKRVVEAHSGKIDVESQVGSGTTFRVRLPLLTASGD